MASSSLSLEVVTPFGVALSDVVQDFTAPSVDGEFGVLPGHRPLLAALKTGIMTYHKDGEAVQIAVGPGFVEVTNDKAVILTDHVARKEEIDPVTVRLELKEADEALEKYEGEPHGAEYVDLIRKELWAAARLTLYGDPPPPTVHTLNETLVQPEREGAEGEERPAKDSE